MTLWTLLAPFFSAWHCGLEKAVITRKVTNNKRNKSSKNQKITPVFFVNRRFSELTLN